MSRTDVARATKQANNFDVEPPRPLVRTPDPSDPFPLDALDVVPVLADAARAIVEITQAPDAIAGQSVLAAAALAVQGHADVAPPAGDKRRPISEFFVTIAETGARKSTVDRLALAPIRIRELELSDKYETDHAVWLDDVEIWKRDRDRIIKSQLTHEEKRKELDTLGDEPRAPLVPNITPSEPTVEGLIRLFDEGHPSLGVFSAEGGMFLCGYGMSQENRVKTVATLSSLWDGEPIRRARGGEGSKVLLGRRLSLHLMIQPTVAIEFLSDPVLANQGILSRILVTAPESNIGNRKTSKAKASSLRALDTYKNQLLSLIRQRPPTRKGRRQILEPSVLPLSKKGRAAWITYAEKIEARMAKGGDLDTVRSLANKAPEHAARIAGILTLAGDLKAPNIKVKYVKAACRLVEHYLKEATRLHASRNVHKDLIAAGKLLNWIQGRQKRFLKLRDVYQKGPRSVRDAYTASRLVKILEEHGWLMRVEGGRTINDVHHKDVWQVVKY